MTVRHKGPDKHEVHKGSKGGTTGCGIDTNKHPEHWVGSSDAVTCARNGCKNQIKNIFTASKMPVVAIVLINVSTGIFE